MGIITELLKEVPISAVLREKVVSLERELDQCLSKVSVLESQISMLQTEKEHLEVKLAEVEKHNAILENPKHENEHRQDRAPEWDPFNDG